MILDNENKNLKVHEWIEHNTFNGDFDIVTGYFTIGALTYISEKPNRNFSTLYLIKKANRNKD